MFVLSASGLFLVADLLLTKTHIRESNIGANQPYIPERRSTKTWVPQTLAPWR